MNSKRIAKLRPTHVALAVSTMLSFCASAATSTFLVSGPAASPLFSLLQNVTPPAPPAPPAPTAYSQAAFSQEQIEQLVAPIALYPDTLVSQVLMASTYPVEVVQAQRWVLVNKTLTGDALAQALEQQPWDPSVKSLVNIPQVLDMMSEKLEFTVKLGDAFIAQQADVMLAIQTLRARALEKGNLANTDQQTIRVEPSPSSSTTQVIYIQPTSSQYIYVPIYDPTLVYGSWPYPTYTPYYYYPPTYYPPVYRPGTPALAFGAGLALGAAWGYAWGNCDWNGGDIDIDIDKNINIQNTYIDRNKYKVNQNRTGQGTWQHDATHRRGVTYRDSQTAARFGGTSSLDAINARDTYRGRTDISNTNLQNNNFNQYRNPAAATPLPNRGSVNYSPQNLDRSSLEANRYSGAATINGAFSDNRSSGQATRDYSQRGQSSRSSAASSYSRPAPSRNTGSRSSGGSGGGGGGGGGGVRR